MSRVGEGAKPSVGVVGVGNMGRRMADRLIAAGYSISVCDVSDAAREAFASRGIIATERPADLAGAAIVIVIVADDAQLHAVMTGEDGLATRVDPAAPPLVIVASTTLPDTMLALGASLAPFGTQVVDAPVSGGLLGAEQGTLSIMIGGEAVAVDQAMPVLRVLGSSLFHCGGLGSGQLAKLVNNMIGLTNLYVVSEAYEIARRSGVDLARLAPVLDASAGRTNLSRDIRRTVAQFATWSESRQAFDDLSRIVRKDAGLIARLAEAAGVATPAFGSLTAWLGDPSDSVFERWRALSQIALPDA